MEEEGAGNLTVETPGKHSVTRMVKVNLMHHVDCMYLACDVVGMAFHLCGPPPPNPLPWSNHEKHKTHLN